LSPSFSSSSRLSNVLFVRPLHPGRFCETKTTRVYTNNSHSETRFRPSRFLCNLGISALNPVFFPPTFNFQLSTSCPSRDLSSQPLTNRPPHNLFLLTSLQMPGGIGDRVQEFLKHYSNSGRISGRLNHLQRDFTSHESPATRYASPCLKSYSPVPLLWAYNRVLSSSAFRLGERPFPPSWRSL
jgi:hypothetical protein